MYIDSKCQKENIRIEAAWQDKLTSFEKNLSTFLFSNFLRERRISAIGGKRLVSNIKLGKMNKLVAPVYKTIKQRRSDRCGVFICARFICVWKELSMKTFEKSELIKAGIRKSFQTGNSKLARRKCYGYHTKEWENNKRKHESEKTKSRMGWKIFVTTFTGK